MRHQQLLQARHSPLEFLHLGSQRVLLLIFPCHHLPHTFLHPQEVGVSLTFYFLEGARMSLFEPDSLRMPLQGAGCDHTHTHMFKFMFIFIASNVIGIDRPEGREVVSR